MAGTALIIPGSFWAEAGLATGDAALRRAAFADGVGGFWFDFWDRYTLFQDLAGTQPVTAPGQSVALVRDKSGNGHDMTQSTPGLRPVWQSAEGRAWLEFTPNQYMEIAGSFANSARTLVAGVRITGGDGRKTVIDGAGGTNTWGVLNLELDDNVGASGNWKTYLELLDPIEDPAEYVLGTDTVVSTRFDFVDDDTSRPGDLRVDGAVKDSGSYDPEITVPATSFKVMANRNIERRASGRLYSLAYVRDYIDPSAIEEAFARRAGTAEATHLFGEAPPVGGVPQASPTDAALGRVLTAGASATVLSASPALRAAYGGSANAITLTTGAQLPSIPTGFRTRFRAAASNTGSSTIDVDGTGKVTAKTITGANLPPDYIRTDVDTEVTFDGTNWIVGREVETGSAASGWYTRYPDGTQYCWGRATAVYASGSTMNMPWTFPMPFSNATEIVPTGSIYNSTLSVTPAPDELLGVNFASVASGSCSAQIRRVLGGTNFTAPDTTDVFVSAIGPWY